jgi:hypothetical protein
LKDRPASPGIHPKALSLMSQDSKLPLGTWNVSFDSELRRMRHRTSGKRLCRYRSELLLLCCTSRNSRLVDFLLIELQIELECVLACVFPQLLGAQRCNRRRLECWETRMHR